jgi:DNA polymerase-3 subunit epsilon
MRKAQDEPPPGSPWDDPLERAPLVFVDCEMTGLKPEHDRIVELCAERCRGEAVEARLESLVRPEPEASGNVHVHGISMAVLAGAPRFVDIADRLEVLLEGAVLVAHAAAWDVAFIEAELARAGHARRVPHYLDTLVLSRRAFALPNHSLDALSREFAIDRARAHRAGEDVKALRIVWQRAIAVLGARTPRELWHVRIGERHARPELVEAAVRAAERGWNVAIRYRPARRAPEDVRMRITAVRTDIEPPRIMGWELESRSRRELRADRILAIDAIDSGEPA